MGSTGVARVCTLRMSVGQALTALSGLRIYLEGLFFESVCHENVRLE